MPPLPSPAFAHLRLPGHRSTHQRARSRAVRPRPYFRLAGAPSRALVPTPAPQPRAPSGIPEINGSPAGFIALVVALSLVTILASLGAVLLARDKPLPHLRLPFRRASSFSFSSPRPLDFSATHPLDHTRPGPDTMRARLARMFGRRPDGWVRADADAWSTDADDIEDSALAPALTRERSSPSTTGAPTFVFAHGARVAPPHLSSSISQDSVEAGLAPAPHSVAPFAARYVASPPPPRDSPSPASSVEPLTPPDVRIHDAEAEHAEGSDPGRLERDDSRVFAVRARDGSIAGGGLRAMRKFENGTKFREALDF